MPDAITLPLLWLGLAFNLFGIFAPLDDSVIGAMAGYLVLWAVYQGFRLATGREGLGYGDFKLLALLGAWLGWQTLPFIIVFASALGAGGRYHSPGAPARDPRLTAAIRTLSRHRRTCRAIRWWSSGRAAVLVRPAPDMTAPDMTTPDMKGRHPMIVALTGGIASGKSEAATRFVELGVPVLDADDVTRRLVEPGTRASGEIVEAFGLRRSGSVRAPRPGEDAQADIRKRRRSENT